MLVGLIISLALSSITQGDCQDIHHRGAMVMGFDQEKTSHHFYLYGDGGAIVVSVKDAANTQDRDAIRAHLRHIASMFGDGDFKAPMLVHNLEEVPGTAILAALKDRITYKYSEVPGGGRVEIVTTDGDAVRAVHEFLEFQIHDHATGDPIAVSKRK